MAKVKRVDITLNDVTLGFPNIKEAKGYQGATPTFNASVLVGTDNKSTTKLLNDTIKGVIKASGEKKEDVKLFVLDGTKKYTEHKNKKNVDDDHNPEAYAMFNATKYFRANNYKRRPSVFDRKRNLVSLEEMDEQVAHGITANVRIGVGYNDKTSTIFFVLLGLQVVNPPVDHFDPETIKSSFTTLDDGASEDEDDGEGAAF